MAIYTLQSYVVFRKKDEDDADFLFLRQNVIMFCMHFVAFMVLYLEMEESQLLFFYGAQVIYLAATLVLFRNLYPKASRLLINHMCMLISIGMIMITRISYDQSIKQFKIAAASLAVIFLLSTSLRSSINFSLSNSLGFLPLYTPAFLAFSIPIF